MSYYSEILSRENLEKWIGEGKSLAEIHRITGVRAKLVHYYVRVKYKIPYTKNQSGSKNPSWKGGVRIDKDGYRLIYSPNHPYRNNHKCVREHRLVAEQKLGRYLLPTEVVHHIDGNSLNNDPENLQVFVKNSDHLRSELTGKCPKWAPEAKLRMTCTSLLTRMKNGFHLKPSTLEMLKKNGYM